MTDNGRQDFERFTGPTLGGEDDAPSGFTPVHDNSRLPIGVVLEVSGSGSQIAFDLQRINECMKDEDPSVALAGQVGAGAVRRADGVHFLALRGVLRPDRVVLLGLDIKMFYGGPKEAVMHGIYRQNMGYTHLVIGRKHADAPYASGEAIWGDFDAQEIFRNLAGDLKIRTVNVGFAAYYESIGRVDLMERHKDEKPWSISEATPWALKFS